MHRSEEQPTFFFFVRMYDVETQFVSLKAELFVCRVAADYEYVQWPKTLCRPLRPFPDEQRVMKVR